MTYAEKLKDPRWQKKRLQVMDRDQWTCKTCKSTDKTLNIHHKKYTGSNPWDAPNEDLITVCEVCHKVISHVIKCGGDVVYDHEFLIVNQCEYKCVFFNTWSEGDIFFSWVLTNSKGSVRLGITLEDEATKTVWNLLNEVINKP